MKKLDLKLGYICNNNCLFCIQGEEKRNKYIPKDLKEIKRIIRNEYQKGARVITFTGGEPTLHKTLIPSLVYARNIGYIVINIQSNGQNFSNIKLCIKLIKAGANSFEPSIHGFNSNTHDNLVKTKGAHSKVIKGIINLKRLGQKVNINSVITKQNYKEIPMLAKLLISLNVDYFQFAFPHIGGSAKKYWKQIVPTKTEIKPYIWKGLDIAKVSGIIARVEAIPFCFMEGYEYAITEQYLIDTSIYDAEYITNSFTNYRLKEGKKKHKKCKKCKKNYICEGPWKEYPERFGWEEFIPIE